MINVEISIVIFFLDIMSVIFYNFHVIREIFA